MTTSKSRTVTAHGIFNIIEMIYNNNYTVKNLINDAYEDYKESVDIEEFDKDIMSFILDLLGSEMISLGINQS